MVSIPIGVVVERSKAMSPWVDYNWRPIAALAGLPDAAAWTPLEDSGDRVTFYAGAAAIELFRTETRNYLANLGSAAPMLWVVLRESGGDPPYELFVVTADPAEGEALTEAGSDLVEPVPMPDSVREIIEAFVTEHHVERTYFKRARDRADPEALGRRGTTRQDRGK
jgi:hypothetical protein